MREVDNLTDNFIAPAGGFIYGTFKDNPGDDTGSTVFARAFNDILYGFYAPIKKYLGDVSDTDESTSTSDFLDAMETAIGVVVNQDTAATIDLSLYISDITVISNPTADIAITFTNELPEGKHLRIWNIAATWKVTPTIEGDTYDLYENEYRDYVGDGTDMLLALISPGQDLSTDADVGFNYLKLEGDTYPTTSAMLYLKRTSGAPQYIHFQNADTGYTDLRGLRIGFTSIEDAIFQNYENTNMLFHTNGLERLRIKNTGEIIFDSGSGVADLQSASGDMIFSIATVEKMRLESTDGALYVKNGISSTDGQPVLKEKILLINDWNMVSTAGVSITHGLSSNYKNIREISVIIRDDSDTVYYALNKHVAGSMEGGVDLIGTTSIQLTRKTTGFFDSTNFDSTSFNRGWIYLRYEV